MKNELRNGKEEEELRITEQNEQHRGAEWELKIQDNINLNTREQMRITLPLMKTSTNLNRSHTKS